MQFLAKEQLDLDLQDALETLRSIRSVPFHDVQHVIKLNSLNDARVLTQSLVDYIFANDDVFNDRHSEFNITNDLLYRKYWQYPQWGRIEASQIAMTWSEAIFHMRQNLQTFEHPISDYMAKGLIAPFVQTTTISVDDLLDKNLAIYTPLSSDYLLIRILKEYCRRTFSSTTSAEVVPISISERENMEEQNEVFFINPRNTNLVRARVFLDLSSHTGYNLFRSNTFLSTLLAARSKFPEAF